MREHRAKKHFGQNFLRDSQVLYKIVQSIPKLAIPCIEIGVGLGDLTQELLKVESSVVAYEVDLDLCSLLDEKFSNEIQSGRLNIIYQDILDLPSQQTWLCPSDYKVVSNLPYYVATHIILRLLRDKSCKAMLVMTQKEVAEKFCAKSGQKEFCALSVLVESFGKAQNLFDVPKEAFSPQPKVTSSVFALHKFSQPLWQEDFSLDNLEFFLKLAFCAPRKKLIKNLAQNFDKAQLESIFARIGISQDARAHEVETASFHQILKFLTKRTK